MQALQLTSWKSPPEVREVPDPDPGPGQVVVRVAAAGACHSDLHLMHDFEPGLLPFEQVSLATTYWGSLPELSEVLDLARRGLVKAHVQRFGLDEAVAAYDRLHAGEIEGRAVIVP